MWVKRSVSDYTELSESIRRCLADAYKNCMAEDSLEAFLDTWSSSTSLTRKIIYKLDNHYFARISDYTLSGNWRTYDSVSVSAGTLCKYSLTGDAIMARLTFTPSTYPATINEAEVVLR
jgi:hypothetical protein